MSLVFRHAVLLQARTELGLTQEEAARALRVDVRTYRRYETGEVNDGTSGFELRRAGRRQLLARIGEELGIAIDELVGEAEPGPESGFELDPGPERAATPTRWRPCHEHVLQPARRFVGREQELDQLRTWLSRADEASPRLCAVVAVGGAGKSALAQRLLEALPDGLEHGVLVWSFYDDPRAEGLLHAVLRYLDDREPPRAPEEALERVLAIARGPVPHLVVLDGFEVMQADGRARPRGSIEDPLLRRLLTAIVGQAGGPRGGMRVLLTSRYPLVDLAAWENAGLATLRLPALTLAEQLALLREWGIRATDAQAQHALERFGGHALSIATLASYVTGFCQGELDAVDSLELSEAAQDDPLAFRLARLLDAYARVMGEAQRDLMARVAVFPRGADVDSLLALASHGGVLAGHMPRDRRALIRALGRLESMGLVYRSRELGSRYAAHPFVAGSFRDRLGEAALAIHGVQRQRLIERLVERPSAEPRADQLDLLEELLVHTQLAGRVDEAHGLYQRALGGFGVLGLVRGDMARGLRSVRGFFVDGDPERPRPELEAWRAAPLRYDLALYASALGDPVLALRSLRCFVAQAEPDARQHTTGLRTTAYVLRLCGELEEARAVARRALAVGAEHPEHVARNLGMLGAIAHDLGDVEEAARCFGEAAKIEPGRRYRRGLWEAEHLVDLGRLDEATALTVPNREACLSRGWSGHVSHCDVVLGLCCLEQAPERAREHLQHARQWAYASGEVEAQLRCFELELRLTEDAEREGVLARADALVQASGYERFTLRLGQRDRLEPEVR
ncbi:XRE family transcriptional regulator [Paraliomyxa miuraensis]|uniref:XRE family transcriptional regulator n=1 Tax=Paraliomyxa miuraensis TaxID=376150 RepID=UPI00225371FB|nr:XRE family transcriptional regulator [Paraliomyxa miuraensis]MCX4240869.1 XRE family transcriptional regulator [Paraliomyxa miuraensis]